MATPFTAFYQNSTPKNSIYQTSRDFNNNKNDWNEFYDITGVRGPHLPLTKDLDIRHDGDPRPNPIHRRQTHVQMTELPFYHSTVFTQPNPTAQAKIDEQENLETYFH